MDIKLAEFKQTSISGVRTVKFDPNMEAYLLKGTRNSIIGTIKGKIDSIYHDGEQRTTFTITFDI